MPSLDRIIALRGLLRNVRVEAGVLTGNVVVDPVSRELMEELVDAGLTLLRDNRAIVAGALTPNEVVGVRLACSNLNYYERFEDFLKHFPAGEPAQRFHVHNLPFTSGAGLVPALFQQYRQAIRLWRLLTALSDHADGQRLFLLSSDKLEIECGYTAADLTELTKLNQLEADFADDSPSWEVKRTLFKRALQEDLGRCEPAQRFGLLLKNFAPIHDRYWQNFRLFLEGISFDKIFEGYVEKHAKLITEFNSVLGGIQTALIGLPIASFVILEKMTEAQHPTFKNTLLGVGCFVFIAFLSVLSVSQGRTLAASKALARELDEEISRKSPDLARKLAPSIARLTHHALWVTRLVVVVRILLGGLACATVLTYAYVSLPSFKNWLDHALQFAG